jgi:hypothetical protein
MHVWAAWALACLAAAPAPAAGIQIRGGDGVVDVTAGGARWFLSTKAFDVIHYASFEEIGRAHV